MTRYQRSIAGFGTNKVIRRDGTSSDDGSTKRRHARSALFLGLVVVAGCLPLAAPAGAAAPDTSWAQSDFGAAHSRANLTESTLTPTTIRSASRRASVDVGVDDSQQPCATTGAIEQPVESGGFVYAIANGAAVKANATTGAIVWRTVLDPDEPTTYRSLALSHGLVIVGGVDCISASDPNGVVHALSATTGTQVWAAPPTPIGGSLSDLVVSGNYVVSLGSSPGSGIVVGVRSVTTGASVWSHSFAQCVSSDRVAVVGGYVVYDACTASGTAVLAADRLADGVRTWSRSGPWAVLAGDTDASTASDLYVRNSHGYLTALVPSTGAIKGTFSGAQDLLAVGRSRIFTTCQTGAAVCAFSRSTRAAVWTFRTTLAHPLAAVAGTVLYLDNGIVLQSDTGARIRTLWTGNATAIIVGEGRVAVTTRLEILDIFSLS